MRFLSLFVLGLLTFTPLSAHAASPSPAPAASASAAPVAPPPASMSDLSLKIIAAFTAGKIDRSMFSENFNTKITDGAVAQIAPQLAALGKLQTITYVKGVSDTANYPVYVYLVKYDTGTVREIIGVDKAGKVDSWGMRP
ncbi:MAG: hypothetical protein GIW97_05555 [Candidatus Eremiobacteraeota bacterium]|nr:hypothetical protein [Candidatus Eremiobacteraeota bacterium]